MDLKETLFKRLLIKRYEDPRDEENNRMAEELCVTKEQNGYALWYQGGNVAWPRMIAWVQYEKDDVISYAAHVDVETCRRNAQEHWVLYDVPKLFDLAREPEARKS